MPMEDDIFDIRFSSDIYLTKKVVNDVLLFIENKIPNISVNIRNDIKLVFQELLVNSVVHGNKEDLSKEVHLHVEIKNYTIKAKIADEGPGFDHVKLLSEMGNTDMLIHDHGRGLRLACSLTDSLIFGKLGNEIYFDKKVTYIE